MKNLVWVLILHSIVFNYSNCFPQSNTHDGPTVVRFLPQAYGIKSLNSFGTSYIVNEVSNLGLMNPASISGFENYSFGFLIKLVQVLMKPGLLILAPVAFTTSILNLRAELLNGMILRLVWDSDKNIMGLWIWIQFQ